ncbi:DUF4232 domain-containing protein [Pseudarthrobacter sp. efr-133-R2A-89]|uniref:DUF4232 domain-containing protein n=1 Tax=Pseudarthrobacter sp. efr-133-R2A-89 TaxID=3040302 RepID=UPI0025525C63|nr:DUF4232 domain-containing protein [Pseudarthrobacter sp. efr-133-R2A-89]
MRSQIISQAIALTTAAAAATLLLTACAPSQPQSQTTSAPATGQASQSPTSSASSAPPSSSAPATAPDSPAPGTSAAGAPALCKAAGLTAATDASGGGAAGSVYMKLNLTNKGTEPCILKGFAGVSLVADAAGAPIGAPATRDDSAGVVDVLLAPGQTGTAVLRYTQAGNYMDCSPVDAAGYRVYPPEDTDSLFLPQPTKACSNAQITLLSIGAFQPA